MLKYLFLHLQHSLSNDTSDTSLQFSYKSLPLTFKWLLKPYLAISLRSSLTVSFFGEKGKDRPQFDSNTNTKESGMTICITALIPSTIP